MSPPLEVDCLITGAIIVTMDADGTVLRDAALAIAGDRIAAIGPTANIEPRVVARERIDGRRFVITPGFVNGHIHVTETLIKNLIREDLPFQDMIWRWMVPLYESHSPAEQRISAELAALSMLRNGTTCFLEAGTILAMDEVAETLSGTGLRGRIGGWIQDRAFEPGQDQAALTDRAIAALEAQMARYPARGGARIAAAPILVGHSTCTDPLWQAAHQLAAETGTSLSAHMSPVALDPDWFTSTLGRRPIEHLAEIGVLGPDVSLTHVVHVDAHEVALLAETGTTVTHCPHAALKGGYGVTTLGRFPEMAAAGVNLMLGTDGAEHADMMRAVHLAAGLQKDARRDTTLFQPRDVLSMATRNAARSLGLAGEIGVLAIGAKADLVLHDTDRPEWRPLHDPMRQLVWSADGRGVHSVWIDGRRVVDDYRCTTIDEERLYAEAQQAATAIAERFTPPA